MDHFLDLAGAVDSFLDQLFLEHSGMVHSLALECSGTAHMFHKGDNGFCTVVWDSGTTREL